MASWLALALGAVLQVSQGRYAPDGRDRRTAAGRSCQLHFSQDARAGRPVNKEQCSGVKNAATAKSRARPRAPAGSWRASSSGVSFPVTKATIL